MKLRYPIRIFLVICLNLCVSTGNASAGLAPSVWDTIRQQMSLDHAIERPEVKEQIQWITAHPSYLKQLTQAEPYLYYIITEIQKRNLPGEIALIPMIESSYDPFAYSRSGAAGLWQLMPSTAQELDLKRDFWFDGRRSVQPATEAALTHLKKLHHYFKGDWLKAFAAYNSGKGIVNTSVQRAGKKNENNFWAFSLPRETTAYIPRLLALSEIIKNPKKYGVTLPPIPNSPYFQEINIGSQIDLDQAAKLAGLSYKELIQLNGGFNRWATPPYQPFSLLVPTQNSREFTRNLSRLPEDQRISYARHQVTAKDNLASIAKQYNTTTTFIKELNQLKSTSLQKGQWLLIPKSEFDSSQFAHLKLDYNKAPRLNESSTKELSLIEPSVKEPSVKEPSVKEPSVKKLSTKETRVKEPSFKAPARYKVIHITQRRDTFEKLEERYGATAREIRKWNSLPQGAALPNNEALVIWKSVKRGNTLVVKKGDTIDSIAKQHHLNTTTLLALNPEIKGNLIQEGQRLTLRIA